MPGVASCLDEYEFAKHGVCFKFDQTAYFGRMIELLTQLRLPILATRINQPLGPASIAPASAGKKDTWGLQILVDPVGW